MANTGKKIDAFPIYHTDTPTHLDYILKVLTKANSDEEVSAKFPDQIRGLQAAYNIEDDIYLKHTTKLMTDEILAITRRRSHLLTMIKTMFSSMRFDADPEKAYAAKVCYQIMKEYGEISYQKYSKETGKVTNLIQDFQTVYAPYIRTLGMTDEILQLQEVNQSFNDALDARTEALSVYDKGALQAARKQTDQSYYDFRDSVNGAANIFTFQPRFQGFISFLNTDIRRLKAMLNWGNGEDVEIEIVPPDNPDGPNGEPLDPPTTDPENPENGGNNNENNENTEGGENNGSNNGENNGEGGDNGTTNPDDPWYNPDDEPD